MEIGLRLEPRCILVTRDGGEHGKRPTLDGGREPRVGALGAGLGALAELESQYKNWGKKMADLLGVPRNPFSEHWADIDGMSRCIEPC